MALSLCDVNAKVLELRNVGKAESLDRNYHAKPTLINSDITGDPQENPMGRPRHGAAYRPLPEPEQAPPASSRRPGGHWLVLLLLQTIGLYNSPFAGLMCEA